MVFPGVFAVLFWLLNFPITAGFFLVLTLIIALFFRNPGRTPPPCDEADILSPADGRIIEIALNSAAPNMESLDLTRISIFMSVFNVHVNRAPATGCVRKIVFQPGAFLDARDKSASSENARNSLVIDAADHSLEVVQVAGLIARKISCWVREGDGLMRGERFGVVHFGSRLDVYLTKEFSCRVQIGQRVRAGVTIIAGRDAK
jgi:phosphatidylserine decarboxylase